jgi:hypothetical protein
VSWEFTPGQKRLAFTLPAALGGERHEVCLDGGYTFTPAAAPAAEAAVAPTARA